MDVYHRKLNLCSLLGDHYHLSVHDIVTLLASRKTMLFILLCIIVLITADAPALSIKLEFWMLLIVWPVALAIYLSLGLGNLLVFSFVQKRFPHWVWPLPVGTVLAVVPSAAACEIMAHLLTQSSSPPETLERIMVFIPSVLVFETFFFRFVLPTIRRDGPTQETGADPVDAAGTGDGDEGRHILIGGQKVALARLLHIEAREHHVKVTLDGDSITHRARLSDIIAQTLPEDGFQPHRSWWVAREQTVGLERDGNRHVVKLRDDTRIPVARTRLSDVEAWFERNVESGPTRAEG